LTDFVNEADAALLRLLKAAKGMRVRPTPKAIELGIAKPTDMGTVTGWGNHRWSVVVLKDGRKKATGYHVSFWKPVRGIDAKRK
jgi:nucleoid-associated protein YgaU